MRYHDIGFDELEELEQEIHLQEDGSQESLNYPKLELYDAMHAHLTVLAAEDEDYRKYHIYIQQKLINYLLCYSGRFASTDANQRYGAERALEKVLQYDPENPVASYRLGCLCQEQHLHAEAIGFFQRALNSQQMENHRDYQLNGEQITRAVLSTSACSLHLASRAFVASSVEGPTENRLTDDFSELFTELSECTYGLQNSAYRVISENDAFLCSRLDCAAILAKGMKDTIVLFFNTEGAELIYNGITEKLTAEQGYLLQHLLTRSSQTVPMTPLDAKIFFMNTHVKTGVTEPVFTKAVEGVVQTLREIEVPSAIRSTEAHGQSAYYFNSSSKFMVMGRVDEEINYK